MNEALAVFRKEWQTEIRSRNGLFASALFSLLSVVAIGFACQGKKPGPTLAAGMLSVTLLFAATIAIPRTYLVEDEQGTFDLIRLIADPSKVFIGKLLYSVVQMTLTGLALGILFTVLTGVDVQSWPLFVLGILVECVSISSAVSVCGAIVIGASNRWVLASILALPLLLPQVALTVGTLKVAFGEGFVSLAVQQLIGLAGFAIAATAAGPILVKEVWSNEK